VRRAVVDRRTRETQIRVRLGIEGKGRYDVSTGIRFLDHMLELMTRHGEGCKCLDRDPTGLRCIGERFFSPVRRASKSVLPVLRQCFIGRVRSPFSYGNRGSGQATDDCDIHSRVG